MRILSPESKSTIQRNNHSNEARDHVRKLPLNPTSREAGSSSGGQHFPLSLPLPFRKPHLVRARQRQYLTFHGYVGTWTTGSNVRD